MKHKRKDGKKNGGSSMRTKIKMLIKTIVAMITFWLVRFMVSEILAVILMQIDMEESLMIALYEWGSKLVTIVIAFPCFIGITRKMGMKKLHIKNQYKLSVGNHITRLVLCLLPAAIMFGIVILLDKSGVLSAESIVSWNQEAIICELLLSCLLMPIVEEVMFRGVLLQNLQLFGKRFAIIVSTVFFVLGHNNPINMLLAVVPGIVFANTVMRTKGLKYNMLYHMIVNLVGKILFPLVIIYGI